MEVLRYWHEKALIRAFKERGDLIVEVLTSHEKRVRRARRRIDELEATVKALIHALMHSKRRALPTKRRTFLYSRPIRSE